MASIISDNIRRLISEYIFEVDSSCSAENLYCTICHRLAVDAYHSFCGCKYCRECVFTYLNGGNTHCCGGKEDCQEEPLVIDSNINKSSLLDKKILKVRVHCPNEHCEIITKLSDMEDHLRVCSQQSMECPYTGIGCERGEASKSEVETHLIKELLAHNRLLVEVIDNLKNELGGLKREFVFLKEELKLKETEMIKEKTEQQKEKEELTKVIIEMRQRIEFAEEIRKTTKVNDESYSDCTNCNSQINIAMNTHVHKPTPKSPWPNKKPNMSSTGCMMSMQTNPNFMSGGQQHQRAVFDPNMLFQWNTRPIIGNRQMNQGRTQNYIVANAAGRPGNVPFPYMFEGAISGDVRRFDAKVGQIELDTPSNNDSMGAKQLLGEKIYPLVNKHAGEMAGKITGMFLELDNAELLYMIEDEDFLRVRIDEALVHLNVHKR